MAAKKGASAEPATKTAPVKSSEPPKNGVEAKKANIATNVGQPVLSDLKQAQPAEVDKKELLTKPVK